MTRLFRILAPALLLASPVVAASMFRGDPTHSGTYASAPLRALHGVKWSFKTGGAIFGSPAVKDGKVFIGSEDRHLYAVDLASGKACWSFASGGPIQSSPAVDGDRVFFLSYDGIFYALTSKEGALAWKFETGGERHFEARGLHGMRPKTQTMPDVWDMYSSSPCVVGGLVYFGCGDGFVYALHEKDGSLAWKFKTGDVVHASPAVSGGLVYVGSWDSYLYALDAATGAVRWKFKTGEDPENHNQVGFQSSPAVVDGVVYVGCRDAHVYALDAATGTERWDLPTQGSWVIGTPVVHKGLVYVGTSDTALLLVIDARTGQLRDKLDLKLFTFSSVAVAGDFGYVGSFDGKLRAIDLGQNRIVWEYQTAAGRANTSGALGQDGRINPTLFQVDADPKAPPFQFEWMTRICDRLYALGAILSSPVVADGIVVFGASDGNLYALD